jgi:cobalt/nickel transport system permease protein
MITANFSLWLPLALHVHDGVLLAPWLAGGFIVAGTLALLATYRIREEEIPRVALLTAAFFVAGSMHLPLGPASVHLLLNGLVGVVLGRRAPLAILVGVGLQAVFGHGGFTTIGVNATVQMLPALLAAGLFALLARPHLEKNPRTKLAWLLGFGIGSLSVLAALLLEAAVLLWGGSEDWRRIVQLVFVAHLPVAGVEGIVLGSTVSFLARVKPEMLGLKLKGEPSALADGWDTKHPAAQASGSHPAALLAVLALFAAANTAQAHRLNADYYVLPNQQIRIECYFPDDTAPQGATVEIRRSDGTVLATGTTDDKGCFVFHFTQAEPLEATIDAGAGHRKTIQIPRENLQRDAVGPGKQIESVEQMPFHGREAHDLLREQIKEILLGVSFVLSVAAFFLSWRNRRSEKSGEKES